jgi:hypothetical protein
MNKTMKRKCKNNIINYFRLDASEDISKKDLRE